MKSCCKSKFSKKWFLAIPVVAVFIFFIASSGAKYDIDAVVYKTPDCGCCDIHARQLGNYYNVEVREVSNPELMELKQDLGIPREYYSCHTTIIDGKFLEGHLPFEVMEDFVNNSEGLDGIALPDMPSGSPGMPGPKTEEWVIYGFKDDDVSVYRRI